MGRNTKIITIKQINMESTDKEMVAELRNKGYTYKKSSETLLPMHPNMKGLSERSVQRFYKSRT